MELPLFYGRDASNCVNECEKFALSHRIYGLDMVDVAFNHMRGLALQWHQNFMRISGDRGKPSWNEYMNVPNVSFGKESEEPLYKLLKLRQNGRVREYQTEFYALAAWTNLNEQQLINTFIGGLRVEIALKVKSMQPTLLYHALCLAKLEESKIEYLAKQLNNSKLPLLPNPNKPKSITDPYNSPYTSQKPQVPIYSNLSRPQEYATAAELRKNDAKTLSGHCGTSVEKRLRYEDEDEGNQVVNRSIRVNSGLAQQKSEAEQSASDLHLKNHLSPDDEPVQGLLVSNFANQGSDKDVAAEGAEHCCCYDNIYGGNHSEKVQEFNVYEFAEQYHGGNDKLDGKHSCDNNSFSVAGDERSEQNMPKPDLIDAPTTEETPDQHHSEIIPLHQQQQMKVDQGYNLNAGQECEQHCQQLEPHEQPVILQKVAELQELNTSDVEGAGYTRAAAYEVVQLLPSIPQLEDSQKHDLKSSQEDEVHLHLVQLHDKLDNQHKIDQKMGQQTSEISGFGRSKAAAPEDAGSITNVGILSLIQAQFQCKAMLCPSLLLNCYQ